LASAAPVDVFVAAGPGTGLAHVELAASPGVRLVSSPRQASVLVAVGRFPGAMGGALARVHDQLPHPRAAVWCPPPGEVEQPAALDGAPRCPSLVDAAEAAAVVAEELRLGARTTRPDVLPDAPPNPFDGLGDHGQGGEGMMGGVPWGRPMAMTGADRDGLALDRSPARLGPFLVGLPPGLVLDVVLQGGVVQEAEVSWLADTDPADHDPADDDPVADHPVSRRRHRLRWLAESCRLAGLDALAVRAARLASSAAEVDEADAVARLTRAVRRSGLVGTWRHLGDGGAAAARLLDRLADLAGDDHRAPAPPAAEHPSADQDAIGSAHLGDQLLGLDWSDALVVVHSLDLAAPAALVEPSR
jgi:hypothetical protein